MASDNTSIIPAISRLSKIDWTYMSSGRYSHGFLMLEFLRLQGQWKSKFGVKKGIFFDVTNYTTTKSPIDDNFDIKSIVRDNNVYTKYMCSAFLRFSSIEKSREILQYGIGNPYTPLIVMFERGGRFLLEHGIQLDVYDDKIYLSYSLFDWISSAQSAQPLSVDNEELESIDQKLKGYSPKLGYPIWKALS